MRAAMKCERLCIGALLLVVTAAICCVQAGEFKEPWNSDKAAIVLDPFQGNTIDWDKLATDARVVGIIHRATIGYRKDIRYLERKAEAHRRSYLWGSYHLGKPGDPIKQADFYLDTVKAATDEVLALDIESLDTSTDISLDDARLFIQHVKDKTGRYPLVYGNDAVIRAITSRFGKDEVFSKTPLWYARFREEIPDFPTGTWNSYTLWQFSSEINCSPQQSSPCLIRVPGTQRDMDINVYNGSIDVITEAWPFGRDP
jgi:lysozyme